MRVDDLFGLHNDLVYLCGSSGSGNFIKYIDVVEIPEGVYWTQAGDFIITTGYFLINNDDRFENFVRILIKHEVVGLGIKLGKYIMQIPDTVKRLADENNFPIISIPLNLSYREITIPVLDILAGGGVNTGDAESFSNLSNFYKNLLSGDILKTHKIQEHAKLLNLECHKPRYVIVFRLSNLLSSQEFEDLSHTVAGTSQLKNVICALQDEMSRIAMICTPPQAFTPSELRDYFTEIYNCAANLFAGEKITFGISECCHELSQLFQANKNACYALETGTATEPGSDIYYFDDFIIHRLLSDNINHPSLTYLVGKYIEKLVRYDKENHSSMLLTLKVLDQNDFNINKSCKSMFLHRNTLYNRIDKINSILMCDLDEPKVRQQISLALKYYALTNPPR